MNKKEGWSYCATFAMTCLFCSGLAYAQSPNVRTLQTAVPGIARDLPKAANPLPDDLAVDDFPSVAAVRALSTSFNEAIPRTRGPQDVSLFRAASPSVVLILTPTGSGSGSLISDRTIITNHHVVENERQVTVVFKPFDSSGKPREDEIVKADVIKTDAKRDLALLRLRSAPPRVLRSLEFSGLIGLDVGADVFAIGHPKGEAWTFTKGIVSQIRPNYEWSGGGGQVKHRADVIQTQTPINPGNSGGPLLSAEGQIVGINSFATREAENLNFAIAASEVRAFLEDPSNSMTTPQPCDKAKTVFEGRNKKNDGFMRSLSLKCDDYADVIITIPDDKKSPIWAQIDWERRGRIEGVVFDDKRSGNWTSSIWDTNYDETYPLAGIHKDGKIKPIGFKSRCAAGSKPIKELRCAKS